jgi:hypothetical protein
VSADRRRWILAAVAAGGLAAALARASAPAGWYVTASQGGVATVGDTKTGLVWQQVALPGAFAWSDAAASCAALGPGWRLPSLKELQTIVDEDAPAGAPSIDATAFPATPADDFWTSSAFAGAPDLAWRVSFSGGNTYTADVSTAARARCVQ